MCTLTLCSPVGHSDLVQEGSLAVDEESVRNPDLGQECPVESQLLQPARVVATSRKTFFDAEYCREEREST